MLVRPKHRWPLETGSPRPGGSQLIHLTNTMAPCRRDTGFRPEQNRTMVEAYCGCCAPPAVCYSPGALQGDERPPLVAVGSYSVRERQPLRRLPHLPTRGLERCRARIGSEDFGRHLTTVARAQRPSAPARPFAPRKSIYSSAMRATINTPEKVSRRITSANSQ